MTRLLLVEDDADVRLIMEHTLIVGGYEVDATGTADGACQLLRCRDYDLVIADGRLLDGTGMQVADEAREKGAAASGHVESDGLILPEWHNATAGKSASTLAILSPTDPYTL